MLGPNCGYEEVGAAGGERGSGKERHTLNYQVGTQRQWAHVAQHNDTLPGEKQHTTTQSTVEKAHNDNRWTHNDTLNYQVGTQRHTGEKHTTTVPVLQHSGERAQQEHIQLISGGHTTTVGSGGTTHWREAHNDTLNLQVGTKKWAHNNTLNY